MPTSRAQLERDRGQDPAADQVAADDAALDEAAQSADTAKDAALASAGDDAPPP